MFYIRTTQGKNLIGLSVDSDDMFTTCQDDATEFGCLNDAQAAIYRYVKKSRVLDVREFEVVQKERSVTYTYKVVG